MQYSMSEQYWRALLYCVEADMVFGSQMATMFQLFISVDKDTGGRWNETDTGGKYSTYLDLRPQGHIFRLSIRWKLGLRRAHFPETNFQFEHPDECLFSVLDSISWCIFQAAICDSLQRLAVLFELSAAPSVAGAQELRWRLITFFYTETEAVLVHSFNYPEGSHSNSIANFWRCKALKKPDDKVNVSYRSLVKLLRGKLYECWAEMNLWYSILDLRGETLARSTPHLAASFLNQDSSSLREATPPKIISMSMLSSCLQHLSSTLATNATNSLTNR